MFHYNSEIILRLKKIHFQAQGPVGDIPSQWADDMRIVHSFVLPNVVLTREEVRVICQDPQIDLVYAYLIVMAWGAQGRGPGGRKHVQAAWGSQKKLLEHLIEIKFGRLTREQEYDLFTNKGEIVGLGPSYFTKLLYFFSPNPNRYIMDQWTMKPIILLTGKNIIRHSNQGPTRQNTGKNYELFCQVIEDLVEKVGANSGDDVEQRLFSFGSIKRQPRGEFRQLVFDLWDKRPQLPRYSSVYVENLLKYKGDLKP
jgi:hypothetical protein